MGRSILEPSFWNRQASFNLPHWISLSLVAAWILLAGIHGGLMLGRISEVRRAKTTSSVPSLGLQNLFDKLRALLVARRHVQLRISNTHHTAVLLGFAHPVVLLPSEMDADVNEGEVELVLRHELAHVVRHDDWYNLAQQFVQCALFFHPAVWWIGARLSLEREIACDDSVLEGNQRPRAYALALANAAGRIQHRRHLLAPGVSNNNSQLQQRITMILNTHRDRSPRLARRRLGYFTTAAALLAALAISAGPRLVLAQQASVAPVVADPAGPDSQSGPRPKPNPDDRENDHNIAPVAPEPPEPPEPPEAPEAPEPPEPPEPPAPVITSVSVAAPMPEAITLSRRDRKNMSVEERLDRIERILERLQARGGVKNRLRSDDGGQNFDIQVHPDLPGSMSMNFDFDLQLKHAAEQAKRAAEQVRQAAENSKRAVEQGQRAAEQAMKDMEKLKSRDFDRAQEKFRDAELDGPARELEALRAARESLQSQIQDLQRHIKRLEEAQNKWKDRGHDDSDRSDDSGPKAKTVAPDKTF
jgi:beta-lactamase regulating signal transducer with metallopeptidase domain